VISGRRWDSGRVAVSEEGFLTGCLTACLGWRVGRGGAGILAGRARLPFLACVGRRVGTVGIEVSVCQSCVCVGEVGPGFSFHFSIFFPLIRALLCGRIFSPTTWL